MLKKPYEKVCSVGDNNYYLLTIENTMYLATESVVRYKTSARGRTKEMQQALKLLPFYSPILLTLTTTSQLKQTDVKVLEGVGEEIIYDTISVKEIREKIAKMVNEAHAESKFDYDKAIKSETVRQFMEENNLELLMKEKVDSLQSIYWLAKTDQFGKLTIHEVVAVGRDVEKLGVINSYFLDKNLIGIILTKAQQIQIRQDKIKLKAMQKEYKRMKRQNKIKKEIENEEK